MPSHHHLAPAVEWTEITVGQDDWDAAPADLLTAMYSQLVLIRTFEEYVLELAAAGLVHGPAHSSIGQEGGAVGSCVSLTSADTVNGSHRGHHQFLAKVLAHLHPKGLDPTQPWPDDVRDVLLRTLREICGLDAGFSHGRGGSMHLQWLEAGAIGTNAIVGGGVPLAAGSAWSHRQAATDSVAVTYFGDGAMNIGSTLETLNLAAAWKLPLCFFVENNLYAVSTHVSEATAEPRLSGRGPGFGIRSWKVDGMDPLAVHLAMGEALAHLRSGAGPALVEADVYRYFHQNGPFPGSAFRYRSKEEEAQWRGRDPVEATAGHLVRRGILSEDDVRGAVTAAKALMASIGEVILEPRPGGKPGERQIKPAEWPNPGFVDTGVRGDLSELAGISFTDVADHADRLQDMKFIDAVAAVMDRRMETDPRVVVLGEDVHRLAGGTNGATKGLKDKYPDRVLGTPISENAFAGLGGGVALDGRFRPVVEFMYADFMWVAADQLFNQIAKARHMFGGTGAVPFVLRSKVAMGTGYGSQHSMDPAGIFATSAGWRIVAPSTPYDYVGLMNTALACNDPVVVLEHVDLYASTGPGMPDDLDHYLPVGKAAVRRPGAALTILTYGVMTGLVLEAVAETGVDAEVVDLRWLDRASLDWDTITTSVQKTNNVLIVEQGARGTSYGAWLGDEIARRLFDWLDAPIERVTGGEASPSISKVLERASFARTEEVAAACERSPARTPARAGRPDVPEILRMPEIAANMTEALLATWLVEPLGRFAAGEPLVTVETEKAAVDVEAEADGVLLRVLVPEGQQVDVGTPIAIWGSGSEPDDAVDALIASLGDGPQTTGARDPGVRADGTAQNGAAQNGAAQNGAAQNGSELLGAPKRIFHLALGSRLARDAGVDLAELSGSGPNGRIRRSDVEAFLSRPNVALTQPASAQSLTATQPQTQASPPASVPRVGDLHAAFTDVPISRMRAAIARRLTESKQTAPHFYVRGSARVDRLLALRRELNDGAAVKVSVNDLVVKAVAKAHLQVPALNVQWNGDSIRTFTSVDVAVAVATDDGLVTPVLRDVAAMSVSRLADTTRDLATRARDRKITPSDLEGGSITVTNLGMFGTQEFAAIINPPQAAILAVGAAQESAVVVDGELAVGMVMRVTLAVDHRPVDGVAAAQWMQAFLSLLERPLQILS